MKKTTLFILLIAVCVFACGCGVGDPAVNDLQKGSTNSVQPADTSKDNGTTTGDISNPAGLAEKITEAGAIERVQKTVGVPPKDWYLEVDHTDMVGGRDYYVVHYYEEVIDDPKTGVGHTATYGWYYVDRESGDVYEMDMTTGELVEPSSEGAVTSGGDEVYYKTYVNGRFEFSIEYPDYFVTLALPENGDGIRLGLPDGSAELTVSGINNVLDEKAQELYSDLVREHNPSYKIQQGNWFAASWLEGDMIVYEKCVVGDGSINTFIIRYPSSQKEAYDPTVEHLSSTFKTPSIDDYH